jgi:hypothetical protein
MTRPPSFTGRLLDKPPRGGRDGWMPSEASQPPRGKGEATASAVCLALEVPEIQPQRLREDFCRFVAP